MHAHTAFIYWHVSQFCMGNTVKVDPDIDRKKERPFLRHPQFSHISAKTS